MDTDGATGDGHGRCHRSGYSRQSRRNVKTLVEIKKPFHTHTGEAKTTELTNATQQSTSTNKQIGKNVDELACNARRKMQQTKKRNGSELASATSEQQKWKRTCKRDARIEKNKRERTCKHDAQRQKGSELASARRKEQTEMRKVTRQDKSKTEAKLQVFAPNLNTLESKNLNLNDSLKCKGIAWKSASRHSAVRAVASPRSSLSGNLHFTTAGDV